MESEAFVRSLEPLERVQLTPEEYVLLKAIIYTSAGNIRRCCLWKTNRSSQVSDASQVFDALPLSANKLLWTERERYASLLHRHLQCKHGSLDGAKRFAEVLSLVDACTHFGQKFWEYLIIMLTGHERAPRFQLINDLFKG